MVGRGFLSFEPGTFTAILGPNGAGKSTLMRGMKCGIAVNWGQIFLMANLSKRGQGGQWHAGWRSLHRRQSFDFP